MEKINRLKNLLKEYNLDGYIVPKNDEFFCEYIPENKNRLKFISNFSGSFGFALVLKNKSYLFVDGRYSLQAKMQSGKLFKIITNLKTTDQCTWGGLVAASGQTIIVLPVFSSVTLTLKLIASAAISSSVISLAESLKIKLGH